MICFAIFAVRSYKNQQTSLTIIFGSMALLFQPFIKIALGRILWNIVDVVVAALVLFIVYRNLKTK